MEPWDGPAAIAFTDGRSSAPHSTATGCGQPATWLLTTSSWCWLPKPACCPCFPKNIKFRGRLQPGACCSSTSSRDASSPTKRSKPSSPPGALRRLAQPTSDHASKICPPSRYYSTEFDTIVQRQRAFGYTDEDLRMLLSPMAVDGPSPSAPWAPTPPWPASPTSPSRCSLLQAALRPGHQSAHRPHSRRAGHVAHQLHRHRAQHPRRDAGALPYPQAAKQPILTNHDLEKLRRVATGDFLATTLA
jgi:glutamate synthase (NADPH) large chain